MAEREFPNNSMKSKEKEEKETAVKSVAKGKGVRKQSTAKKAKNALLSDTDASSIWDYILLDVLVPSAKKAMSDVVKNGVDMLLYGEVRSNSSNGGKKKAGVPSVSYQRYYDREQPSTRARRSSFEFDDILFESRGQAESVLSSLEEIVDRYHIATVFDYYELSEMVPKYTYKNFGWTNLSSARITRIMDDSEVCYVISLPKAMPID